jgi:hypothetical protein
MWRCKQIDWLQQEFVTSFRFANPGYAQVRESLMLVRPRVMGEKTLALDRKPRHLPFQFEATSPLKLWLSAEAYLFPSLRV